ncbi:MAG: amidohydrolase family protein [Phycisphaerales bacterium]|nr:amidohydrolase family protein [Phycisphaerales bacterium]
MSRRMDLNRRSFLRASAALGAGACVGPLWSCAASGRASGPPAAPDLIVRNARITTLDSARPEASALASQGGRFVQIGTDAEVMAGAGRRTMVIDAGGRRLIPGLNDSHMHIIRGGLNYNLELRWDGVSTLADALEMLRLQALATPPPQWVRVVGGWNEHQFRERRMPTLDEVNRASPDVPVFVLHLYDRALLNRAALRAVGYTRETPDPPGSEIQRDARGEPTGLLLARPNAFLLYKTLSLGPRLGPEDQLNSTRHFMREVNRLGVTSVIDAGGGFQNYPEDYAVIEQLHRRGQMTVRIAYNLFAQNAGQEKQDFARWVGMIAPGAGDSMYRHNGAGENLVASAADFENFLEPRPDLSAGLERELEGVVGLLVRHRWPFRLHATYDESISRFLDVFERVNREVPFAGLRWFFDHAETVSDRNLERIRALDGGVAVQHRMAFQGEYFVSRYGAEAARRSPPIRKMLRMGIPVGAGTDGTRVASYNPWVAFSWMIAGRTVGGLALYGDDNLLSRQEALRLLTQGSAHFSGEQSVKGIIAPGQYADFAVLDRDCMSVGEVECRGTSALLTVLGGQVVFGAEEFRALAPPDLPVSPDWSPVKRFGGYQSSAAGRQGDAIASACGCVGAHGCGPRGDGAAARGALWGPSGCDCFVF